ncbi:hypothetical protein OC846_005811 [Tilletia horrida]|uniref:Uncharacterized protein n=1 Tax=Tilletia horrida TaxID=155126 RepID=A0AAN6GPV1_9BASI|nr:hypothetical protein OC845_005905 [Tilletia horrida]KAK0545073.1 hypothetical protein OC846_005811 [Tilletia horrida]KAK0561167.1 hypothetical protein OC861_005951 [Tilletia horrida]
MENVGITIATTVVQVLAWACFPLRWWLQNDCHHVYKLMSMCGIMPPRAEKRKVNNESARELDRRRSERSESIPLTFIQRGGAEQASTTGVEILRAGSNSAQTVHQRRRQAKEGEVTLEGAHAALCAVIPDPAERRGDSESDPDYRERLTLLLGICQKVNTGIRHFSEGVDFPKAPYAIPDLYVEVQRQRNELLPSDLVSDYTLPEEHPSQRKVRLEQALSQMLQSSAFRLDDDIFVYCSEEYVRVLRHTSLPKHRLSILQALFNALQFTLQHWVKLHYVAFEYSDALHQADKAINAQEVLVTTCNLLLPSSEERFKDMYFFFTLDRLIELTRKTDERTELLSFINHAVSVIVKRHATGSCMTHGQAGRLLESISTLASYAAWTSGEDTAQVATWKRELRRVDQEEKASSYRKSDQTDHMHGTMTRRRQRRQADQDDPDDSEDM